MGVPRGTLARTGGERIEQGVTTGSCCRATGLPAFVRVGWPDLGLTACSDPWPEPQGAAFPRPLAYGKIERLCGTVFLEACQTRQFDTFRLREKALAEHMVLPSATADRHPGVDDPVFRPPVRHGAVAGSSRGSHWVDGAR